MTEPLALVTGAPGWLGTRLVESLARGLQEVPELATPSPGQRIRCLVVRGASHSELKTFPGVQTVEGDVTDPPSLERFVDGAKGATLFHCAGVIHPRWAADFFSINARGTENVVRAACRAGVRRIVHVSSNSPFGGNDPRTSDFDEISPYRPYMSYGQSKLMGERAVLGAGEAGLIHAVVVRAPWFYGPGQPPRQTLFFTMIRTGRVPLVGDGENRRSMAYIDNLCQGLLLAARVEAAAGKSYWIADERPYSMNEILGTIETVMERDCGIPVAHGRMRLPSFASDVARVVDRVLQSAGLYHQKIHVLSEMTMSIACSVEHAKRELGYRPTVALEEGMRRSLAWMRSRGIEP